MSLDEPAVGTGRASRDRAPAAVRVHTARPYSHPYSYCVTTPPDPDIVVTDETQIDGTHRGSVHVRPEGHLTANGTIQGSLLLDPNARATIRGKQQGSVHVSSGADLTVYGAVEGSLHVEHHATVTIASGAKLAGSLHNEGLVIVRGVFGGARFGRGELRFEDQGYEKRPDEVRSDGTVVYRW